MGFIRALSRLFGGSSAPTAKPEPVPPAWRQIKAFVQNCEMTRLSLGGLRAEDAAGFWTRRARIHEAQAAGMPKERVATEAGFASWAHWALVERYFEARYSELAVNADGSYEIRLIEEFRQASVVASRDVERISVRAAEMKTLDPIEGITLDRFAEIAAAMTQFGPEPSRRELSMVLGGLGVGPATYGAARRGWHQRMQDDKSGRLKARYREVFYAARQRNGEASESQEKSGVRMIGSPAIARRTWVESDLESA